MIIDFSVCSTGFAIGLCIGSVAALMNFIIWFVLHLMQS